ncbi:hypothetical protein H4W33_002580 [Kibdelosporangium phytohabitans]|nr:hypothetical protein [Kibdelosporangium phytohabitans]
MVEAIRRGANEGRNDATLLLTGSRETDNSSWRRFNLLNSPPYLVVDYNSYPNAPYDLGIEGYGPDAGHALSCAIGGNRSLVGKRAPRLRARALVSRLVHGC